MRSVDAMCPPQSGISPARLLVLGDPAGSARDRSQAFSVVGVIYFP